MVCRKGKPVDLRPVPSEAWQTEYDALMDNPWLASKLERAKRIDESYKYIGEHLPEMFLMPKGVVIDIGPGPGEFLEIARNLGHDAIGIDAETGDGGMGNEYLRVSQLMTLRQNINVTYTGFETWVKRFGVDGCWDISKSENTIAVINSRGSIEQCLSDYMTGTPHDQHHRSDQLDWKMETATSEILLDAFEVFAKLLRPGGILLIHANGTGSNQSRYWYDACVCACGVSVGLKLVKQEGTRLHKWEKSGDVSDSD